MNADGKFVGLIRGWLCTLPHDLKVAYDAMDDENLSREQRELAVGAIIYVVSPQRCGRRPQRRGRQLHR
jgi:hypothetical protein